MLLLAALVCVACSSCSICEEFPIPEGLEDSALFLDEVAQVLVPNPPEVRCLSLSIHCKKGTPSVTRIVCCRCASRCPLSLSLEFFRRLKAT